jgi:hypothetical protein
VGSGDHGPRFHAQLPGRPHHELAQLGGAAGRATLSATFTVSPKQAITSP